MMPTKKTKKSKVIKRRKFRGAPKKFFRLLDTKGEVFDDHATRTDAYNDATGPRFYKGYYVVEYKLVGVRRYRYEAGQREVTGVD